MPLLFHATDLHLNFLPGNYNKIFLAEVLDKVKPGNILVVTGDIAEGPTVAEHMLVWQNAFEAQGSKLYFVCGNHDYYRSSIESVRDRLKNCSLNSSWLPTVGIVKLSDNTALIGHDGWYDGQYDNWFTSKVDMTDYYIISELGPNQCPVRQMKYDKINELAQESADYIYSTGTEALKTYGTLYIATHIPPFREAAVHQGKPSDKDWMPHFSSKRMGDAIRKLAQENPGKEIVVLCGHTHGEGVCHPEPGVVCYTGKAEYRYPRVGNSFLVK